MAKVANCSREQSSNKAKKKPKNAPPSDKSVDKVTFPGQVKAPSAEGLEEGLEGDTKSRIPALLTGILTALVGLLWWWAFRRYRHPLTWLIGVVPFLLVLFVFYVYLERLLPAKY